MRVIVPLAGWLLGCLLMGALAAGCSANDDEPPSCAPGVEAANGTCATCPPWTLPGEGGNCGCFDGFELVAAKGTCEPVLPPGECPPDTMPMLGRRACQPVGVAAAGGCARGFVADGRGGCDAILPKEPCPAGSMAVPGDSTCHEVAPCGEGTWGDIADEPGAVYVDKSYTGDTADGSKPRPFKTIQAAVDAAKSSALVAVAEGVYAEDLRIEKPLRLRGRCPAKVEIQGTSDSGAAVVISAVGKVSIEGLSVTGAHVGIDVVKGTVEIARIRAHDLGGIGLSFRGRSSIVTVRDSLVERARSSGIGVIGAIATVEATVVRDSKPDADKSRGTGIHALVHPDTKAGAELVVRGSLVERNLVAGIAVFSSKGTIESTVVRDTGPQQSDSLNGQGIYADVATGSKLPTELVVRGSLVTRNHTDGIVVAGSKATIEATVVSDTISDAARRTGGRGISAAVDAGTSLPSDLVLRGSVIERNRVAGILVQGSRATIERTVIRDTKAQEADGLSGRGITAILDRRSKLPATIVVREALVERNHTNGIGVLSANATIESTVIRDTQTEPATKKLGVGLLSAMLLEETTASEVAVRGVLIERNHTAGILALGAKLTVEAAVVRDSLPRDFDKLFGQGVIIGVDASTRTAGELVLRGTLVERSRTTGVRIDGSKASIETTVIRDTLPAEGVVPGQGPGVYGRGIEAGAYETLTFSQGATLGVRGVLVEQSHEVGIAVLGSTATIEWSEVRDTRRRPNDGLFGDGVLIAGKPYIFRDLAASAVLRDLRVSGSARVGVASFGDAAVTVTNVRFVCNAIDLSLAGDDVPRPRFDASRGGNVCGCESSIHDCRAQSTSTEVLPIPGAPDESAP